MASLSFLDLPMEIRQKILQQVVFTLPHRESYIYWTPNRGFFSSPDTDPTSLFLVSKSFSALAQQIFWSQNQFTILPPKYFLRFTGDDDHIPSPRTTASYFLSRFSVLQPLPHLRSLDLRQFEIDEEEEMRSDWFSTLDYAIHQGRLDLDFLSIDVNSLHGPDWESIPHDNPDQLFRIIKSFISERIWPLKEGERPISIAKCLFIDFHYNSINVDGVNIWYRSRKIGQDLPEKMESCRYRGNELAMYQFRCGDDDWSEELWVEILIV